MSRLKELRKYVDSELNKMEDSDRRTGAISYDDHAHKGSELARKILGELNLTDEAETDMICSAIYHHDDKLVTDEPMDEVLKDADVIDHCLKDTSKPIKEKEQERYDKLCAEFGINREAVCR